MQKVEKRLRNKERGGKQPTEGKSKGGKVYFVSVIQLLLGVCESDIVTLIDFGESDNKPKKRERKLDRCNGRHCGRCPP